MPDEPTLDEQEVDNTVLWRLCASGPCAVPDLARELSIDAEDAVGRLVRSGLAYRMKGGFVIASAAGRHAHGIDPSWL